MTKTLILMRHAKSSWAEPGMADVDRPLNRRGRGDAPRMGEWLKSAGLKPDLVLVSPARRTRDTFEGLVQGYGIRLPNEIVPSIYEAEPVDLLELVRVQRAPTVMLLGHNPGCEQLLRLAVREPDLNVGYQKLMPTAAVYVIEFEAEWADIDAGGGTVTAHARPKLLASEED